MLQRIIREHPQGQAIISRYSGAKSSLFNTASGTVVAHLPRQAREQDASKRMRDLRQVHASPCVGQQAQGEEQRCAVDGGACCAQRSRVYILHGDVYRCAIDTLTGWWS
jgi:hypothetical protein